MLSFVKKIVCTVFSETIDGLPPGLYGDTGIASQIRVGNLFSVELSSGNFGGNSSGRNRFTPKKN